MTQWAILLPIFAQVLLTFVLLGWTGVVRVKAIRGNVVRPEDIALDQNGWPDPARRVANCFRNQLELPLLFYLACIVALMTAKVSLVMIVLSWLFVALRIVHAAIHVTNNNVQNRFLAFAGGVLVLLAIWLMLILRIIFEGV